MKTTLLATNNSRVPLSVNSNFTAVDPRIGRAGTYRETTKACLPFLIASSPLERRQRAKGPDPRSPKLFPAESGI